MFRYNRHERRKSQHELEVMDLKQRLENQSAAIDELKRKKEQGSMQAQGEAQEVLIEQKLVTFSYGCN